MVDLFLAELTYHPESKFGKFFTAIGELPALIPVIYAFILIIAVLLKRKNADKVKIKQAATFLIYMILTVIATAIVVSLLKKCWGRVRYVDLGTNAEGFTPWYLPQGLTGGKSFPSGHSAMASLIFLIPDGIKYFWEKRYRVIDIICTAFLLSVIIARMLMGAHYLSDLIAGACIAYVMRRAISALLGGANSHREFSPAN